MHERAILAVILGLTGVAGPALAASRDDGYRNCDLGHLRECQDSNQLFWGLGASGPKQDFRQALRAFLTNAPGFRADRFSFTAAAVAEESLTGPDGPPVTLQDGELLFFGFTPHDAPDKGAVAFDGNGKIIAVALLNRPDYDSTNSKIQLSRHILRIYVRDHPPSAELTHRLTDWAARAVDGMFTIPGLPRDILAGTELWSRLDANTWKLSAPQ